LTLAGVAPRNETPGVGRGHCPVSVAGDDKHGTRAASAYTVPLHWSHHRELRHQAQ